MQENNNYAQDHKGTQGFTLGKPNLGENPNKRSSLLLNVRDLQVLTLIRVLQCNFTRERGQLET